MSDLFHFLRDNYFHVVFDLYMLTNSETVSANFPMNLTVLFNDNLFVN